MVSNTIAASAACRGDYAYCIADFEVDGIDSSCFDLDGDLVVRQRSEAAILDDMLSSGSWNNSCLES